MKLRVEMEVEGSTTRAMRLARVTLSHPIPSKPISEMVEE